jgi:hypothetical protein
MKAVYFPPASCKHYVPDLTLDLQAISPWGKLLHIYVQCVV